MSSGEPVVTTDVPAPTKPKVLSSDWDVKELKTNEKPWAEKNTNERVATVGVMTAKVILVILTLFLFLISLNVMGNSFKLLGGKSSGRLFRESDVFNNPVAGLVMGILTTVLVQSSSTSTSIIVTMAAGNLVTVKNAIPMIMGANIGTAVTASIVSVSHMGNKDEYRRAFAGSIAHYCFNVLTTLILLPVETFTGMLQAIAEGIVDGAGITDETDKSNTKQDFLKLITKPVGSAILQVDKKLVNKIAAESDIEKLKKLDETTIIQQKIGKSTHLFTDTPMSDEGAGLLMVILSLCFLSACLILLVKTLKSIFKGRAAMWISKGLNLEIKGRMSFLADYILMLIGLGLTILMQSSSITTATLTPLVGIGLVRVDKMFPFTIGANIGTTVTGLLAALATDRMRIGMQVALSHLIFNLLGTMIWFVVPFMRKAPLAMAYTLGGLAADIQAFPILFILTAWVVVPAILLGLSIAHAAACALGVALFCIVAIFVFVWYILRKTKPELLPVKLRKDPSWMPKSLRLSTDTGDASGEAIAEQAVTADDTNQGSADLGSETAWWQAPLAWGPGYFLVMMLIVAVWNCQWAKLQYPKFDGRDHVGIGAWQTCSKAYESDMPWAKQPLGCSAEYLSECAAIEGCNTDGTPDVPGANSLLREVMDGMP